MELKQRLGMLRDHWILVVACTILGVLGAGLIAFTQTPMYAASAQLFVSTSGITDVSQAYQGGLLAQQRVTSYADIIASRTIAQRVIGQLHLTESPGQLQSQITASAPPNTVLIDYTVTDPSPTQAQHIAASVGTQFIAFVNQLETPQGKKVSPVKVSFAQLPAVPSSPVSPNKTLDLGLGLFLGLAVGVGGALLRESLDNTVGNKHEASEITGAPVLGAIAEDPRAEERPLIVQDDRFSPRAESFRKLRTSIRFLDVDHARRAFVVTSSVEEEGKTATATNLAIAAAQGGSRVILVDSDLRRPMLEERLGLPAGMGLTNVLVGDVALHDALQVWRSDLPLRVLASGPLPPNPSELLDSARMSELVDQLAAETDVLIFDSPPLLPVTDAAVLARMTGGAILVARVGHTRVDQLRSAAETLQQVGAPILGVVLSRIPRRGRGSSYAKYGYGYGYGQGGYQPVRRGDGVDDPGREMAALDAALNGSSQPTARSTRTG